MLTQDFNYHLPKNYIANSQASPRDSAQLMKLNKKNGTTTHHIFNELPSLLKSGDTLILNNTKVFPARLSARKKTGGQVEILLLKKITDHQNQNLKGQTVIWECLLKKAGQAQEFIFKTPDLRAEVFKNLNPGRKLIRFFYKNNFEKIINQIGQTPLPPYIQSKKQEEQLRKKYQTIYATKKGSVAAPTAGLHFTKNLFQKLTEKNIHTEYITLRIGLGTFQPVKTKKIQDHQMHAEYAQIAPAVAKKLNQRKKEGRRLIAVGSTSLRTLESFTTKNNQLLSGEKETDIFITPGYEFKFIDGLITNFHLPKSTLLMLVAALAGQKNIFKAYQEAIQKKYRFFSLGDAMLIL